MKKHFKNVLIIWVGMALVALFFPKIVFLYNKHNVSKYELIREPKSQKSYAIPGDNSFKFAVRKKYLDITADSCYYTNGTWITIRLKNKTWKQTENHDGHILWPVWICVFLGMPLVFIGIILLWARGLEEGFVILTPFERMFSGLYKHANPLESILIAYGFSILMGCFIYLLVLSAVWRPF